MSEGVGTWASGLGMPEDTAARFETIAREFDLSAATLVGMLVARVVEVDAELRLHGLTGLSHWRTREKVEDMVVPTAMEALPIDVRPTSFMWPADRPFPWTADECRAAVLGYEVRWRGTAEELLVHLRGKWEMSGGYAVLYQP